jgi:hypothetical protein
MQVPAEKRSSIVKYWLGLSLLGFLTRCGKPATKPDLTGVYVADYAAAREKITLLQDGTFTQQVTVKSTSQMLTTNGNWTFDPAKQYIYFHDAFLCVLNGFGQPNKQPEPGTSVLPVVRRLGNIQIGDEPSVQYKKEP